MNGVLNLPFMLGITDIPDWVSAEVLNKEHSWNFSPEDIAKMYNQSPMSRKMKVPILNLVGAKDRRVPY